MDERLIQEFLAKVDDKCGLRLCRINKEYEDWEPIDGDEEQYIIEQYVNGDL